jgi:hypothetical protein
MSSSVHPHYERYLATFATREPDRIVALHAPDGTFWLRTGREPVVGRPAIATAFADLFAQWPEMTFEVRAASFGPDFWVLDWVLDAQGRHGRIRFGCLDLVHVDTAGLVASKHTFVDLAQATAALAHDARASASHRERGVA